MSDRPSFAEIHMGMAFLVARRSTCVRKSAVDNSWMRVGCVITTDDHRRVLASGYNGNASGLPNICDDPGVSGGCGCIHAECNAVVSCVESRSTPKIVYCTHLPCVACAKLIIQLGGVRRVVWAVPYRIRKSVELLWCVGIEVVEAEFDPEEFFKRGTRSIGT